MSVGHRFFLTQRRMDYLGKSCAGRVGGRSETGTDISVTTWLEGP